MYVPGLDMLVFLDDQSRLLVTIDRLVSPTVEAIMRYTNDGAFDTTFGVAGAANTPSAADISWGRSFSARVQKDGRIVVLSWAYGTNVSSLVVSRLWN